MGLLTISEKSWLDKYTFISYYRKKWPWRENKEPYIDLAKRLYSIVRHAAAANKLPAPDEHVFYPMLYRGMLGFPPFKKLIASTFPYNRQKSAIMNTARLFAKLIIDEDWAVITS